MGLPICYLDQLFWNKDKTTVSRDVFQKKLAEVLSKESWIIDGNYSFTLEERLEYCDTVFLLDYPTEVCLNGVRHRIGNKRPDMPWIEEKINPEFMDYIRTFREQKLPQEMKALAKFPNVKIYIFKNRAESHHYLNMLQIRRTKMKKFTKLSESAILVSLFALFVGKKLDDKVKNDRNDEEKDRGVSSIDD